MAMDVQRTVTQLKSRLSVFTGPQRIIIGLLAVVGVIAATSFYRWVSAPSYDVLLAGMAPADASAVTAQLDTAGIPYQLENGGATVLVPAAAVQKERLAIAAAGLPAGTTKGYELLDKQGMTASSFQQKVAYQRAIEGELAKTLMQMKDIHGATVHLSIPDKQLFTDQVQPTRASVLLDSSSQLTHDNVDAVQRLVAAAVPDLQPTGVTVSDTKGRLLSGSEGASGSSGQLQAQQAMEDQASARADTMLASVLGPGRAVVRVNAQIDSGAHSTESETYDPTKSVTLRESSSKEDYKANGVAGVGGIVSVPDPAALNGSTATGGGSNYTKADGSKENGVTRQVSKDTLGPGSVKRLSVAVIVDGKAVGLPPDRVISDLVSNAVGLDVKRGDTISVAAMNFAPTQVAAPATAAARDWTSTATVGLAVLLLLFVALAFLKAARRSTVAEIPLAEVARDEVPAIEQSTTRAIAFTRTQEIQDDLRILELVDSRPDEVTALIRGWLADPADAGAKK